MNSSQKKVLREQYRNAAYGHYRRESAMSIEKVPVTKAETAAKKKKLLARIQKQRQAVCEAYRKRSDELGAQFSFAVEFKEAADCLALIKKRRELK